MKFRTKTVLGVMLIQTVLLSVMVMSVLSQMRSSLRQQIELRANVTAQLVAAAARDPMVSYDVSTLNSLATDMTQALDNALLYEIVQLIGRKHRR